MKNRILALTIVVLMTALLMNACAGHTPDAGTTVQTDKETDEMKDNTQQQQTHADDPAVPVEAEAPMEAEATVEAVPVEGEQVEASVRPPHEPTGIVKLGTALSGAVFAGDYGFDAFLESGGAKSDADVFEFLSTLTDTLLVPNPDQAAFACSTTQLKSENGYLFGRNLDWGNCNALVLTSYPTDGYASVSTVNTDFITGTTGKLPEDVLILAAHYAPLDGINEKGLCISVNMLPDGEILNQNTDKPDLQITTAVRLMLNRAATVEEAVELLGQYDLHRSYNSETHFMIADAAGACVAVEYIKNEMIVIDAKVMTNCYLAEGELYGKGKPEAQKRYDAIVAATAGKESFTADEARDVMACARRSTVLADHITQWTVIYDQTRLTSEFYHREDYTAAYPFSLFAD
ncbi:MAG: linear amide C-N hydrolase [Lachnospiraceae bacterium]|nr:linear amide C-N hydrolase [Lachnospiraceae bacterium]